LASVPELYPIFNKIMSLQVGRISEHAGLKGPVAESAGAWSTVG
jgi:hypothetical protein